MKLAFVFPGQGAQYVGMGQELSNRYRAAQDVYHLADEVLGMSLSTLCFTGPEDELRRTYNTQPALLATSVAAMRAFEAAWDSAIEVTFVAGHSLGEYTACVAAQALSLPDALTLVRQRGHWMDEAVPTGLGAMAAVLGMEAGELAQVCADASRPGSVVEVANVNCPGQIVISGETLAVQRGMGLAKERGAKRSIPLVVSGPFHSSLMQPAADKLEQALRGTDFRNTVVPVVANVNGARNTRAADLRQALAAQLCQAVQWEQDVRVMLAAGVTTVIEFGPGTVLSGLVRKVDKGIQTLHVEDEASLQETVAQLRAL